MNPKWTLILWIRSSSSLHLTFISMTWLIEKIIAFEVQKILEWLRVIRKSVSTAYRSFACILGCWDSSALVVFENANRQIVFAIDMIINVSASKLQNRKVDVMWWSTRWCHMPYIPRKFKSWLLLPWSYVKYSNFEL